MPNMTSYFILLKKLKWFLKTCSIKDQALILCGKKTIYNPNHLLSSLVSLHLCLYTLEKCYHDQLLTIFCKGLMILYHFVTHSSFCLCLEKGKGH